MIQRKERCDLAIWSQLTHLMIFPSNDMKGHDPQIKEWNMSQEHAAADAPGR